MCGCGGSSELAPPVVAQTVTQPDGTVVTTTPVGPSAPGYFWNGPPGYSDMAEPAPAADE